MQKTTAKVEHRDYVPWGWIAIEFCDVNFYGFRAEEMERKWSAIKNKRYDKYDSLFKQNETQIKDWRNAASAIRNQVKRSKPFYRFWYNKTEKDLLATADKLSSQANKLEAENQEVKNKRFFGVYECHRKIEDLLQQNGFVLTHTSSGGEKCVTKTEVWTREE